MRKRTDISNIFKVRTDLSVNSSGQSSKLTVADGLTAVLGQGKAEGLRKATLADYEKWFTRFTDYCQIKYLDDITANHIYNWINSMDVQNSTKRIRLKALKAVLGRLFNAGMLQQNFWRNIIVKVDEEIKEGATEADIQELLSHMDMTNYFHLRDTAAILLMWQTGIRISTLSQLKTAHIDFEDGLLICTGNIMKNGRRLVLPLSNQLLDILNTLIQHNQVIAEMRGFETDLIFISQNGKSFQKPNGGNTLTIRLNEYSKQYGIKNINPHSIRRGFGRRLLDEGVSIPVISKALSHNSLAVTTRYLNVDEAELINELKRLQ